jgi:hypothetical protein
MFQRSLLPLIRALMMEAATTSEMLVNFYQTTWHYNPEDSHLRTLLMKIITNNLVGVSFSNKVTKPNTVKSQYNEIL